MTESLTADALAQMRAYVGKRGPTFAGPDPVNRPMIRQWCAVMGDRNPVYTDERLAAGSIYRGVIAPPAMLQAWVMPGYGITPPTGDPVGEFHQLADALGYSAIVATNIEQEYLRELRPGDVVHLAKTIESVSDEKKTALGPGVFLTTRFDFSDQQGESVARMLHRVLRFKPGTAAAAVEPTAASKAQPQALRPRPNQTQDNSFYFEAAKEGKLLIQRCTGCGRLRHPPTAACAHCGALGWDTVQSAGKGTLFSYTAIHAPVVQPFRAGHVVGLVELEEGIRVVAELVRIDAAEVRIGMPLEVDFLQCDPALVLPVFGPRAQLPVVMTGSERAIGFPGMGAETLPCTVRPTAVEVGMRLATLKLPVSRTFIVASALATRDYQDVHHDPDLARARGSQDIFLNILTTTGLVGRFVSDAFGPDASLRKLAIRLGATCYPGDCLVIDGSVVNKRSEAAHCDVTVSVRGAVSGGDHVTGEVTIRLPAASGSEA